MAKCILFTGQSLGKALCNLGSSTLTPHADTHMWNGSGWSAPVGDGAIQYANCLRMALQEHIYLINACVDGSSLLSYGAPGTWNYEAAWSNASGTSFPNAVSATQATLSSVPGLTLDRIEFWQGQAEAITGGYANMVNSYMAGLGTLLANFRSVLGDDFRFCVWPVGKTASGTTQQVIRAQMTFATDGDAISLGVEPGPASYDMAYADGTHLLNAAEYGVMGIRGARNAVSYFLAKANNALSLPHYGAGPQIVQIIRHPAMSKVLLKLAVKPGHCLMSKSIWTTGNVNAATGFAVAWGIGNHDQLTVTDGEVAGGFLRVHGNQIFTFPLWVGYQQERNASAQYAVYDSYEAWYGGVGQALLPLTFDMLTSD